MSSIIFFGTPDFAAEVLDHLVDCGIQIKAIVTQPDRPKGRSLQMTFSPVKIVAQKRLSNIPILQPERCSNPEFLEKLTELGADLYVVVAFGQILPVKLLQMPPLGCINVHASLLPKYRGAAPIQRSILNGDRETGISIQKMVKELDAGDVIVEERIPLDPNMTFGELEKALCELSKKMLPELLSVYASGVPSAIPQIAADATFAPKISSEEGEIDWGKQAIDIHNLVRAFSPRPGAWCYVEWNGEKKRVKILRTLVSAMSGSAGSVLSLKEGIIGCGEGAIQLLEVQPEGKPKMSAADWLRGARVPPKF